MAAVEVPRPPEDTELRNIIDKLAQFVAKNGSEFEQMTKHKQKDNPKFGFLFGGDYYHYYQYKMAAEQAILKKNQQQQQKQHQQPAGLAEPTGLDGGQVAALEMQLVESEKNLKAQYDVLQQQQQAQIDLVIQKAEQDKIKNLAGDTLNLEEFGHVLDQLANSCTKEAISNGKQWIFNNCTNDRGKEILLMYMVHRVRNSGSAQDFRLHVLYLINDWAHHCMRKKQDSVNQILSRYVPQLYAAASQHVKDVNSKEKLEKLMNLWESQKYFDDNAFKQLRNPSQTFKSAKTALQAQYAGLTAEIIQKVQTTYNQYQQQHQEFSRHVQQQISSLQQSSQQQFSQGASPSPAAPKRRSRFDSTVPPSPRQPPPDASGPNPNFAGGPGFNRGPVPGFSSGSMPPPNDMGSPEWRRGAPPYGGRGPPPMPPHRVPLLSRCPPWQGQQMPSPGPSGPQPWAGPPPRPLGPPNMNPPPMRPRPPLPKDDSHLIPNVPYYDLPAGLMVPLIQLEDTDYKPLDHSKLRLPPPMPPSDRLLAAIESFYAPPNHENPRDSDGWEKLGLYEYFKEKAKAKQEARSIRSRSASASSRSSDSSRSARSQSRSPSPRKRSPSPRRTRSRSRSSSESPPRFTSAPEFPPPKQLSESNKGHQMLSKMGWGGGGLGAAEHGIEEPVPGGVVRSQQDMYRGVGSKPDPYEAFRQQQSGHFMQKMMAGKQAPR